MSIDAGDILRFAIEIGLVDNVIANLVTHYECSSGSGGDEDTVHQAILDNYTTALEALDAYTDNDAASIGGILWNWDFALNKWIGVSQLADTTFAGGDTGASLPAQNAIQIDYFSAVPKRQGRKYIPAITELAQQNGDLVAGAITAAVNCALLLDNNVVASGVTIVNGAFASVLGQTYFETFQPFNQSTAVETYMSTQRRRKPGVGI